MKFARNSHAVFEPAETGETMAFARDMRRCFAHVWRQIDYMQKVPACRDFLQQWFLRW